jgi:hypothetical protein
MAKSQQHSTSRFRGYLLYSGYLALWTLITLIAFKFLFPEKFAYIKHNMAEVNTRVPQYQGNSSDKRSSTLKKLHHELVHSRWPLSAYRHHHAMGYELTPGVSVKLRDHSFTSRTHELGFRIPLAQDQHLVEAGGLLSIGCSFTYGDQVEAEQTFSYIAGGVLGLPSYNYGTPSYSYVSALLRLEALEQSGQLDQLQPSAIILGAGGWLFKRSTTPYYPTGELQYGYAYLAKENARVFIKQPPEQYSLKHRFEFSSRYFPNSVRDVEFTPERLALLEEIAPTIAKAQTLKMQWKTAVTQQDLYDFVAMRLHEVALARHIPAVILWLPYTTENTHPPRELVNAVKRYENVHLLEGNRVVANMTHKQKIQQFHPTKEAHRRYGEQIAGKLRVLSSRRIDVQDQQ